MLHEEGRNHFHFSSQVSSFKMAPRWVGMWEAEKLDVLALLGKEEEVPSQSS